MSASLSIPEILKNQRQFFATGKTRELDFRIEQLKRLQGAIADREGEILEAVTADLGRGDLEAYIEVLVGRHIDYILKHIKSWTKRQKVSTSLAQFPASAYFYPEPLGVALIISPWNYPIELALHPLAGAIAAGNCAILKPSEISSHTSKVIANLVSETFEPDYIAAIEGDAETSQELLAEKFDKIFFTGGTHIGKIVMKAAAEHLTPVTLELGGKSPCIVDEDINLEVTAKRIIYGKCLNAGQSCIAPDYILVQRSRHKELVDALKNCIREFYGDDPQKSTDYARIISPKHFDRLVSLLDSGTVVTGGKHDRDDRYIAPTLLDNVDINSKIMQEEIFGPILPILPYDRLEEAIAIVNDRSHPLALYFFSNDSQKQEFVLQQTHSGGVCLNDTMMHIAVEGLPFGGVGDSGMGCYHGKATFDTFSHYKSVLKKFFWLDLDFRYPPYSDRAINWLKKVM